jgi:hypothetical protein
LVGSLFFIYVCVDSAVKLQISKRTGVKINNKQTEEMEYKSNDNIKRQQYASI